MQPNLFFKDMNLSYTLERAEKAAMAEAAPA
jgi:hypothetical protein